MLSDRAGGLAISGRRDRPPRRLDTPGVEGLVGMKPRLRARNCRVSQRGQPSRLFLCWPGPSGLPIIRDMRILLTNDDGILAPGLTALLRALQGLGELGVAAPAKAQSGVGHGITVQSPITAQWMGVDDTFEGWAVDGRPADCVKLAIMHLLPWRPDYVISGINAGLNTGLYTLYSGTVAGAAEAAVFFGIPAMAVSLEASETPDFAGAGRVARQVFERYAAARPQAGSCINVNIPSLGSGRPKGVRVCVRSRVTTETKYRKEVDSLGRWVFCFEGGDPEKTRHPNTDSEAVLNGYVAVTPLRFDGVDEALLREVSGWVWPERFA